MNKRAFIKDPLWGNVELFTWEKRLTDNFILNRLTNIIQNSSAFRAYPGLKYSRFLHTLGVVHVTSQLVVNAIINAEPNPRKQLLLEADSLRTYINPKQTEALHAQLANHLGDHPEFEILLATLRMCAFIHDLGHLPYSHVFENALDSFMSDGIEATIAMTNDALHLRGRLKDLLAETSHDLSSEPEKIHERLGLQLASALRQELAMKSDGDSNLAGSLIEMACQLLRSGNFPISQTFIKSTIDADRIDFSRRDGHFSGLFNSAIDYGRLFSLYTLGETESTGTRKIVARPSPRATSETEKLLLERFQGYKYIVMHHKVHFYDEVVENLLVYLLASGQLNGFLKDLISLLEAKYESADVSMTVKQVQLKLLQSVLLEFDDPWLESHIRSTYRKNLEASSTGDNQEFATPFQVYVEERKHFVSAFKADWEFWAAVKKYAPRLERLHPHSFNPNVATHEFDSLKDDLVHKRAYFFKPLYNAKFSLQKKLHDTLVKWTPKVGQRGTVLINQEGTVTHVQQTTPA